MRRRTQLRPDGILQVWEESAPDSGVYREETAEGEVILTRPLTPEECAWLEELEQQELDAAQEQSADQTRVDQAIQLLGNIRDGIDDMQAILDSTAGAAQKATARQAIYLSRAVIGIARILRPELVPPPEPETPPATP